MTKFIDNVTTITADWLNNVDKLASVTVSSFGAKGDGVTDDTAAIQAALDYMGSTGGGRVTCDKTNGRYRITKTLKIPSHTTIMGVAPSQYPYNDVANASSLWVDFTDPNQWVLDTKTTASGATIPYNAVLSTLPDGATFNCGILNLFIQLKSTSVIPFGGIRIQGSPGAVVDNVSIVGPGTGTFVNESFGSKIRVHTLTPYYGVIGWNDVNACSFDLYTTQGVTKPKTVPSSYRFAPLASLNGSMVSGLGLTTEGHSSRPFSLVLGADSGMTSSNNEVKHTHEYFDGGVFMYGARSTFFPRLYLEGAGGDVSFGVVAAYSTFNTGACHAYLSGTGTLTDIGAATTADICLNGVISYSAFGTAATGSILNVRGVQFSGAALTSRQSNIHFPDDRGDWVVPDISGASWVNAGGPNATVAYRFNGTTGNIELKGYAVNGVVGGTLFTLPVGYRPLEKRSFAAISGTALGYVIVLSTGEVIAAAPTVSASGVSLDGITFKAEY